MPKLPQRTRGLALALATAAVLAATVSVGAPAASAGARHRAAPRLAVGVTTWDLAINSTRPWQRGDLRQVRAFERLVHTRASIVMWYADWAHARPELEQLRAVAARGDIPEITWEPWNYLAGPHQSRFTLASIIAGRHDVLIRRWARALRRYRGRVLLRFAQEMNSTTYPWCEGINGNRPGQFVKAWRHVHAIFARAHATNVRWIWSPVARGGVPLNPSQYPGERYVDIVGLSGFNAGRVLHWGGWRSFAAIFGPAVATLRRLAPTKPIQISEVASVSVGGDQARWIRAMFAYLATQPRITSLVWFDLQKQTDWRITSRRSGQAFAAGLRLLAKHGAGA